MLRLGLDLTGEEYQLDVISDGEQAMRFVDEHRTGNREEHPCVILMDLHLPRYGGLEILQAIRRTPPLAHIQVVVLTSLASPSEEREIRELGGVCLLKPSDFTCYSKLAREVMEICKGMFASTAEL